MTVSDLLLVKFGYNSVLFLGFICVTMCYIVKELGNINLKDIWTEIV